MDEVTNSLAEDQEETPPGIVAVLGELAPGAIITEKGVAQLFGRCTTSVKRAVERGELPPPIRLFGTSSWTAGVLVQHLEKRLEAVAIEVDQMKRKMRQLGP